MGLQEGIIALVAFVILCLLKWLARKGANSHLIHLFNIFSTVCFHMHTKIACVRGFIFALAAFILLFSTVSQIICLWSIEYDIIIRAVDCINQSLFESIKHFHRPRQFPWFYGSRVVRNPSLVAAICLRKSKMVLFYLSGRWAGGGYFPAGESETSAVATPGLSPATAHPLRGRKFPPPSHQPPQKTSSRSQQTTIKGRLFRIRRSSGDSHIMKRIQSSNCCFKEGPLEGPWPRVDDKSHWKTFQEPLDSEAFFLAAKLNQKLVSSTNFWIILLSLIKLWSDLIKQRNEILFFSSWLYSPEIIFFP